MLTASRSAPSARRRGDRSAPRRHIDVVLLASVGALNALGLLMVYSSSRHRLLAAGLDPQFLLRRQAVFTAISLAVMVVVAFVDYRHLRDIAPVLWVGTIVALLLVLTPLGSSSRGAHAWFQIGPFNFEPSEVAKLTFIIVLAAYGATHRGDLGRTQIVTALGLAAVPMTIIYLQPDLGTAMVFAAMVMGILLVAGARPRHILVLTGLGVVGVVAVFQLGILKEYQLDRLTAFLDPQNDPARSSYNLRQSTIAIAAGEVWGKGVFQGTQTNLSFVPEQHTDFIFTAVGEELGFVGGASLLALFALVIWRTWRAAALAKDGFGTLVCVGVLTMFLFQIFENVGMTMGITPIAGIPLPFVSYGGSSLVASWAAIGLVQSVHMRRYST